MVDVNFARRRPSSVIALHNVGELRERSVGDVGVTIGAGVTYTELQDRELATAVPALAQAARTVGSPQIRNAGTIGGNIGTASPAGDTLPVLVALDAVVDVQGVGGTREVPIDELFTGPKRTALAAHEVITAVRVPPCRGPQEFLKVGTRNAMIIATVSVALVLDRDARTVRVGLGAVGPVALRAVEAERFAEATIDWDDPVRSADATLLTGFADRVADAARPIDDHRSTAGYRRHAVQILARRALQRACSHG